MNSNNKGPSEKKPDGSGFFKDLMHNPEASITYVLLIIGILLLFFNNVLLGSFIVGLIAGYHFSQEIMFYLRNLTHVFNGQNRVRYIVLTAVIGLS